jgi:nucleotide-binding universal stress UspA family protein
MSGSSTRRPVVVGVSRSETSHWAVCWAADQAAWRGLPLLLLHAQEWPTGSSSEARPGHPLHVWSMHYGAVGRELLRQMQDLAWARHPGLDITVRLVEGRPLHALRTAAQDADQLVLGGRKLTESQIPFAAPTKAASLLGRVACPIVLVTEQGPGAPHGGPVVVGVGGSGDCEAVLGVAFEQAVSRGVDLQAVTVRRPREAGRPDFLEAALLELSEALAGWCRRYPDLTVHREVLTGDPAQMLATAARSGSCLVIGSRDRGGMRDRLLGSCGRYLVHRSPCPLVVVPHSDRSAPIVRK